MDRRDKNNGNNGNGDEARGTKRDRVSPPQQQAAYAALTGSAPQLQPIALTGPNNQSSASAGSGQSHSHGHHHKSGHHHHHHGKHAPTLLGMGKMDDNASRRTSKRKRAKVVIYF